MHKLDVDANKNTKGYSKRRLGTQGGYYNTYAKPIKLEGYPNHTWLVSKDSTGAYTVVEERTGRSLGVSAKTIKEVKSLSINKLNNANMDISAVIGEAASIDPQRDLDKQAMSITSRFIVGGKAVDYSAEVQSELSALEVHPNEIDAKIAKWEQYMKDGKITKKEYKESVSELESRRGRVGSISSAAQNIQLGEFDETTDRALEGTPYEAVATDSNEDTVDELPRGAAREMIDNTLAVVKNFLPLEEGGKSALTNRNEAINAKKDLTSAIEKARAEYNKIVKFIKNKETRDLAMGENNEFDQVVERATENVDAKVKYFENLDEEKDMTVATTENLFPEFLDANKGLGVKVGSKAREVIEGLESKETWVKYLKAELQFSDDTMSDMLYELHEATDNEAIQAELLVYMSRKNDDFNCKNK